MTHAHRVVLSTALAAFVMTAAASAQTLEEPRLTVGVGAGVADPFHGDFDFTAPTWQASVRGHTARHFVVEGFLSGWQHNESESFGLANGTGRIEQETKRTIRVVGVNFLARSTGRVSVYGGGGPGYWLHERRFTQTPSGCDPSSGQPCGTVNTFNSAAFSVQGTAGVDAALTSRIIAYGQYQIALPVEDVGIGHSAFTAGIRIALR